MNQFAVNEASRHLYFIRNSAFGLVKIGASQDVGARKRSLEVAAGLPLEVALVVPHAGGLEKRLHKALRGSRQVGEWFVIDPDLQGILDGTVDIGDFLTRCGVGIPSWLCTQRHTAS